MAWCVLRSTIHWRGLLVLRCAQAHGVAPLLDCVMGFPTAATQRKCGVLCAVKM